MSTLLLRGRDIDIKFSRPGPIPGHSLAPWRVWVGDNDIITEPHDDMVVLCCRPVTAEERRNNVYYDPPDDLSED